MINLRIVVICGIAAIVGCADKDNFTLSYDDLGFAERRTEAFPTNASKTIDQMMPDDVIVAVNGYPLTKRVFDDLMALKYRGIVNQKDMSSYVADQMMKQHRETYVRTFQAQRMLLDDAFRQNIVTTNALLQEVMRRLTKEAKRRGKTIEETLKPYGKGRKYLLQEIFTSAAMDKLIAEKIPPLHEVDDTFIKAVQDQVTAENAAAAHTNAVLASFLKGWKKQIIEKNLDFAEISKKYSDNPDPDGVWGTFEEGDLNDPKLEAAVFSLPKNAISDVVEDFNGFHLIKVLDIYPAETNEVGRIVSKERRKLAHIYLEKNPELIRMDDIKMSRELKRQMQLQAVDNYVTKLSTNGTTRIEYPNGLKLVAP